MVFVLQQLTATVGLASILFVLSMPFENRPWALVTSIYAHANTAHLFANAIGMLILGLILERRTTAVRFHLFFISTGALAGAAEIWFGGLFGPRSVLGASGAVFAILGYLLAGNRASTALFDRITVSPKVQLLLFVVIALGVTISTGGPGVALVAHFTGLIVGLLSGRLRILDA